MNSGQSTWGSSNTQFFFSLTPDRILDAVELFGLRCTGRCLALNSMENRVYEVEIALPDSDTGSPASHFRVAKFYRPGRWTKEQIREEHQFLLDLVEGDVAVVAPIKTSTNETVLQMPGAELYFSLFPKLGGRLKDELTRDELLQVGRLIARVHTVGARAQAQHRLTLNVETYGRQNLAYLLQSGVIPENFRSRYQSVAESIFEISDRLFEGVPLQRIHGDAHVGNLLWNASGPFWVDFDDMVRGPAVQDLWLLVPGRDEESMARREILLSGYEQMRDFDRSSLYLIEPLRALRMIHFSAWIARRWEDPAFPRGFPQFGGERYWGEQIVDLSEQLDLIRGST